VLVTDDQKSLPNIVHSFVDPGTDTATLAHQTRYPGPKQGVDPLHPTGPAVGFVRDAMLPSREKRAIHRIIIGVNQLLAIRIRHHRPQFFQHGSASIANNRRDYLSGLAGARHPEPEAALLADTQLVYLDSVTERCLQNGIFPLLVYPFCPFCRTFRTVSRLTLSKRAMPRCDSRSAKARSISASFSGVKDRSTGWMVKVLPQALHRQRAVPDRFVPNRTTLSTS
jgi:hypothetical protein